MIKALWQRKYAFLRLGLAALLLWQAGDGNRVMAAFNELGRGARAPGMADTFVAIADDANAVHYNPAGLAQLAEAQLTAEYSSLLKGTTDGSSLSSTYLGYAYPFRRKGWGTIGMAYHQFNASNLLKERTVSLSYGWKLKVEPFQRPGTLLGGLTIKQLYREFQPDRFTENSLNDSGVASGSPDPLFARDGYSSDAYAVDLGGLYRFGPRNRYGLGLAFINLNQPDVSLGGDGDKAPLTTKLGLSYRPNWGVVSAEFQRAKRLESATDNDVLLGAERVFRFRKAGALTLRGGYAQGGRDFKAASAGASYQIGQAEFDYAFDIPIGNLNELQGSHRVGFTFRLGQITKEARDEKRDTIDKTDLIAAFASNAEASHVLISRSTKARQVDDFKRLLLLQVMVRKYALDDPGLADVRKDLSNLLNNYKSPMMGWPEIKQLLSVKLVGTDKANLSHILDLMAKNNTVTSLNRFPLLSPSAQKDGVVKTLNVMGLAELAAASYRAKNINDTIEKVRQMMIVLPNDEVLERAYRQLVLEQSQTIPLAAPTPVEEPEFILPEPDQSLVAPTPVVPQAKAEPSKEEVLRKNFTEALGYYFLKKASGATPNERAVLLNQMKHLYRDANMDMSLVDKELAEVQAAPQPATTPTPVETVEPAVVEPAAAEPTVPVEVPVETPVEAAAETPVKPAAVPTRPTPFAPLAQPNVVPTTPVPVKQPVQPAVVPQTPVVEKAPVQPAVVPTTPAPVSAPTKAKVVAPATATTPERVEPVQMQTDTELSRLWRFYRAVEQRGITDYERIELLNDILKKHGGSPQIIKEYNRIWKRLVKDGATRPDQTRQTFNYPKRP